MYSTKEKIIKASIVLLEKRGLINLTVDEIMKEAGFAKGTFYRHYREKDELVLQLHKEFHDILNKTLNSQIESISPGEERLRKGTEIYWDFCIKNKLVKSMLFESKMEKAIANEVKKRNEEFISLVEIDFIAMNRTPSKENSWLFVKATAEIALEELELKKKLPNLRTAFWNLFLNAS